jgi:hypothetical protein
VGHVWQQESWASSGLGNREPAKVLELKNDEIILYFKRPILKEEMCGGEMGK